ncbi:hypothetical protein ACQP1W_52410 (plasmid) [Spirillospora sp. CA-255316]
MVLEREDDDDTEAGLSRGWLITAVIAVGILVVLVVVAVVSSGGDGSGEKPAAVAPSTSAPAAPSSSPSSSATPASPSASASASPAAPVERWRGQLTLEGPRARRDLDVVPPRTSETGADIRGDWLKTVLEGEGEIQMAVLPSGERPGARACRDAALAEGVQETRPLREGDVVCAVTEAGRVARLVTVHAAQTTSRPTLTFAVVLWDVPGGQ